MIGQQFVVVAEAVYPAADAGRRRFARRLMHARHRDFPRQAPPIVGGTRRGRAPAAPRAGVMVFVAVFLVHLRDNPARRRLFRPLTQGPRVAAVFVPDLKQRVRRPGARAERKLAMPMNAGDVIIGVKRREIISLSCPPTRRGGIISTRS